MQRTIHIICHSIVPLLGSLPRQRLVKREKRGAQGGLVMKKDGAIAKDTQVLVAERRVRVVRPYVSRSDDHWLVACGPSSGKW